MKKRYILLISLLLSLTFLASCSKVQTINSKNTIPKDSIVLSDLGGNKLYFLDVNSAKIKTSISIPTPTNLASLNKSLICFITPRDDTSSREYAVIKEGEVKIYDSPDEPYDLAYMKELDKIYIMSTSIDAILDIKKNEGRGIRDIWSLVSIGKIKGRPYLTVFRRERFDTLFVKDAVNFKTVKTLRYNSEVLFATFYQQKLIVLTASNLFVLDAPSFNIVKQINLPHSQDFQGLSVHNNNVYVSNRSQLLEIDITSNAIKKIKTNFLPGIFRKDQTFGYLEEGKKAFFVIADADFKIKKKFLIDEIPTDDVVVKNKIFFINDFGSEKYIAQNKLYFFDMKTNRLTIKRIGKELVDIVHHQ